MAAVLAAASYSRGVFSICLASSVRRVMVPGGSMFRLEPGTIDAIKNVINQIAHIFHRSTSQPDLENLSLPPMLP